MRWEGDWVDGTLGLENLEIRGTLKTRGALEIEACALEAAEIVCGGTIIDFECAGEVMVCDIAKSTRLKIGRLGAEALELAGEIDGRPEIEAYRTHGKQPAVCFRMNWDCEGFGPGAAVDIGQLEVAGPGTSLVREIHWPEHLKSEVHLKIHRVRGRGVPDEAIEPYDRESAPRPFVALPGRAK